MRGFGFSVCFVKSAPRSQYSRMMDGLLALELEDVSKGLTVIIGDLIAFSRSDAHTVSSERFAWDIATNSTILQAIAYIIKVDLCLLITRYTHLIKQRNGVAIDIAILAAWVHSRCNVQCGRPIATGDLPQDMRTGLSLDGILLIRWFSEIYLNVTLII